MRDIIRLWDYKTKCFYSDFVLTIINNEIKYRICLDDDNDGTHIELNYNIGCKDMNNKGIYEGDILQYYPDYKLKSYPTTYMIIEYDISNFRFAMKFLTLKKDDPDFHQIEYEDIEECYLSNCIIIGNIYENADLIKI
jgi:uncharacterized phage protein (TIGR01671 family)